MKTIQIKWSLADKCTRTSCWYKHNKKQTPGSSPDEEEIVIEWINDELDNETEGVQGVQIPTKPQLNQQMGKNLINNSNKVHSKEKK